MLEFLTVRMEIPAEANIIIGQSHFIKTVEDIYEAVATTAPQARFGLAFKESSGACLIRSEGNDQVLRETAIRNVPEVCSIFCATANSVEVVLARSEQGQGVLGVIDGSSPKGIEEEADVAWRHDLLRKIG